MKVVGQVGMDERIVDDAVLEDALEDRWKRRASAMELGRKYQEADKVAKGLVEALGLSIGEVIRVGRFRIEKRATAAREVSFETKAGSRIAVTADEDD